MYKKRRRAQLLEIQMTFVTHECSPGKNATSKEAYEFAAHVHATPTESKARDLNDTTGPHIGDTSEEEEPNPRTDVPPRSLPVWRKCISFIPPAQILPFP